MVGFAANLHNEGVEIEKIIGVGGMMTDVARNHIVDDFLKTKSEYLFWLDDDNPMVKGAVSRMIATRKTLITGVYVKRNKDAEPLLYTRLPNGDYSVITEYTRGEIIPVDSAGMGHCLCHRSVFEDIQKNFRVLKRIDGGIITVHKDNIVGDIFKDARDDNDGKVIGGVLQDRIYIDENEPVFPFFMLAYGRSEDYGFYEKSAASGHFLWADTSIEVGHLGTKKYTPADWRKAKERG